MKRWTATQPKNRHDRVTRQWSNESRRLRVMAEETDPYLEVARRFFNEFLELKISLDREGSIPAKTQEKERAKHEKELRKWTDANKVLRDAAQQLVKDNERLENEVARLETER